MEETTPLIFVATTRQKFKRDSNNESGLCKCNGLDELGSPTCNRLELLGYSETENRLIPVTTDNVNDFSLFIMEDHIKKETLSTFFKKELLQDAYLLKHDKTNPAIRCLFNDDTTITSHNVAEDNGFTTVYAQVGEDITSGKNVYKKVLDAMENALQTARNSQGQNGAAPSHTHIP